MQNIFLYLAVQERTKSIINKLKINSVEKLKHIILNANQFPEVGILTIVDLVYIYEKIQIVNKVNNITA